jgi:adenylate kinase
MILRFGASRLGRQASKLHVPYRPLPRSSFSFHNHSTSSSSWFVGNDEPVADDPCKNQVIRDLFMSYARQPEAYAAPCLHVKDVKNLLHSLGEDPSEERLAQIVDAMDYKRSGTVDLDEFLAGYHLVLGHGLDNSQDAEIDVDKWIKIFRTLDLDGNAVITIDELDGLLSTAGGNLGLEDAHQIMKLADVDNNGSIDLTEFIEFVTNPAVAQYSWRLRSAFRAILVIGGPGSGKGLLCQKLVERAGIHHCSSGDLLRQEVVSGSPLGKEIETYMKDGKLLPSSTIMALMKKQVSKLPGAFVALDGFPRSIENYHDFDRICGAPEFAIYIDVPDDVMMERILKRGKDSGRVDDNEDTGRKRLHTFHSMGKPTLEALQASGIPIHVLDGRKSPDEVWVDLLALNTPLTRQVLFKSSWA